jgi:Concanavalin A-like lectin/glucanases superfamily
LVHPGSARAAFGGKTSGTANWATKYFSCKSAMLASSPSMYYRFEETGGTTATDSGPYGFTGTYGSAGITYKTPGACSRDGGKSITLDGSSGYLYQGTQQNNPGTFSSEIWFKTTTTREGWLVGFGGSATGASSQNDRQTYMTNSGQICFGVLNSGAKEILSPASYNDGLWHDAIATFSAGTGMRLYLDGNLVASNAEVTSAHAYNGYVRIGYDTLWGWPSAPTSNYFAGSIDEVAAYSTVLSAADVASHYSAGT